MPLPEDFNPWEHFQDVFTKAYNQEVREEFNDLGGDDWDPDIHVPRGSLRIACTALDEDSALMLNLRAMLFYMVLRKARDLQAPVYGSPVGTLNAQRKYRPQILFYFKEDPGDVEPGYDPLDGRISYRLMNETFETITKTELTNIANRVKTIFGANHGLLWKKGKDLAAYTDPNNGRQFQLFVRSKADAKIIIEKVLETIPASPNWKHLTYKECDEPTLAYPTIPPSHTIMGHSYKEPRYRGIGEVRFQNAVASIWPLPKPITLYDRTYTLPAPLVQP